MRVRRFVAVSAIAAALTLGAAPAQGASMSAYLSWGGIVAGPCGTTNTYHYVSTTNYDPDVHSATRYKTVTSGGNFETIVYNENGVSTAQRWYGCVNGQLHNDYIPTIYKHREIDENFICYGGSCQYLYTVYQAWLSGVGNPM